MKFKGEMSMLNVLHLQETDVDAICAELQNKRDEAPQFFMQSPLIVDCDGMGKQSADFDFSKLKTGLLDLGFVPVGIRNIPTKMNTTLAKAGWAVMRENRNPLAGANNTASKSNGAKEQQVQDSTENMPEIEVENAEVKGSQAAQAKGKINGSQQAAPLNIKSFTVERPVRSGQQIYAADADMTVLAQTSAGSEIMADGSIHVYGPLRGRVLAGARGNENARIFCQSLQAELIAIAGRYQLLDESDTELKGKPAMIRLDGEKLLIEPLVS